MSATVAPRPSANAMNRDRRFVPAPRTCIIAELFDSCERHNVLLIKSTWEPEDGWLFVPGRAIKISWGLDYDLPGLLFLPDHATRKDQLKAVHHLDAMKAAGGAL